MWSQASLSYPVFTFVIMRFLSGFSVCLWEVSCFFFVLMNSVFTLSFSVFRCSFQVVVCFRDFYDHGKAGDLTVIWPLVC